MQEKLNLKKWSDHKILIPSATIIPGTIEDLAVDWRGKNLYWTNSASKKIGVTNYNGSIIGSISLDEYLEAPRAIDVDPIEGKKSGFRQRQKKSN